MARYTSIDVFLPYADAVEFIKSGPDKVGLSSPVKIAKNYFWSNFLKF